MFIRKAIVKRIYAIIDKFIYFSVLVYKNMDLKINVAFRNVKEKKDTKKRSEHVLDRMALRGIGKDHIKDAVTKGAKKIRKDGSIISEYRWFRIIYREYRIESVRKIYPITVMEV